MKLKKGDNVIVISGKDKGKKGKITRVLPTKNKVVIEDINVFKKSQRPRRSNEKGEIINIAMPMNSSNVMLIGPKCGKPSRIGKKEVGGKMVRIARKSNQEI